jgi:hypothetical protein
LGCWQIVLLIVIGCSSSSTKTDQGPSPNQVAATGDSLALALAQRVEDAVGGKENWDQVKYLSFNFFGSRFWYWDKHKNRYRVESRKRNYRIAGSLDGLETQLWIHGVQEKNTDSLAKYHTLAYQAWVNDTYWLIAPFKLNDAGVILHWMGTCVTPDTMPANCIQLTFEDVGVTPDNKYHIYVDTLTNRIIYWEYFDNRIDTIPDVSNSWTAYERYGSVYLSGGRGRRSIDSIQVFEKIPERLFSDVSLPAQEIIQNTIAH